MVVVNTLETVKEKEKENNKMSLLIKNINKSVDFYKKTLLEEKIKNGEMLGELESTKNQLKEYEKIIDEQENELDKCFLKIESLNKDCDSVSESINIFGLKNSTYDKMVEDCENIVRESKNKKIKEIDEEYKKKIETIRKKQQNRKQKYNIK